MTGGPYGTPARHAPAPRELIVRAHAEASVWVDRAGHIAGGGEADSLRRTLEAAGATLWPVVEEPPSRLRERAPDAPREAIAAMARYYRVRPTTRASEERVEGEPGELTERLLGAAAVDIAYVKPPAASPVLPPSRVGAVAPDDPEPPGAPDDFSPRQGYLWPAPAGIGAEAAWERPGGRGAGVRVIDVEAAWNFAHEDLRENPGGVVAGSPPDDQEWRNHGTNVAGILGGDHNGRGVSGICPDAWLQGVSFFGAGSSTAAAIQQAADALHPGDIMLVEMMRAGPRTPRPGDPEYTEDGQIGYIALDYWPDDFAAIAYAVSRGIIVVEAAGNGSQHLDDRVYAGEALGFGPDRPNPFGRDGLDSGAIFAGAGAPPPDTHGREHGPDRARLEFSNWGSCLDAQGWGREVTTTGGLGSGPDGLRPGPVEHRWYTDRFSGTSSAAPIVAGALACVQGVLRAAGRRPLTPGQARAALRETGSRQRPAADGSTRPIGRRPNLAELVPWALEHAGTLDDPRPRTRRRSGMRVTITIDDDGDGRGITVSGGGTAGPYVKGPYVKGPSLHIPREDGTETVVSLASLEKLAGEGGEGPARPSSSP